MLRTLAHQGYVMRRADGAYTLGLAVADRFRELVSAMRGPAEVGTVLRRASARSATATTWAASSTAGIAITAVAEGSRSPHVEDLVPGFDEGAHATALGKNLSATLDQVQRERYLKEHGMRAFTQATLRSSAALDADIAAGMRRGMQVEIGQFRSGVACAAVSVRSGGDLSQRYVVACALPAVMVKQAPVIRERLHATARACRPPSTPRSPPSPAPPQPDPPSAGSTVRRGSGRTGGRRGRAWNRQRHPRAVRGSAGSRRHHPSGREGVPRRVAVGGQLPIGRPSSRQVTTMPGLAKSPSGQVRGRVRPPMAPAISPGCCTATNTLLVVVGDERAAGLGAERAR